MIRPQNESEDLLLSITTNCEMLSEQTHRKAEETLEITLTKSREIFLFNPPISIEDSWMLGLVSLELYQSIFNITQENTEFELFTHDSDDDFSFVELKDKVAEVLGLADITAEELEHEIHGPDLNKINRKLSIEKSLGFYVLLYDYTHSTFRDFESYLRVLTGLDEDDIQLVLKQYNSKFITYKISPGFYTFTHLADVFSRGFESNFEIGKLRPYRIDDKSHSVTIECDNVSLITKLIVRHEIRVLRVDKKSFFSTILGFSPYWDCKNYGNEYYSEKNRDIKISDKFHLKCDVRNGNIQCGKRQPTPFSFSLDKPVGYKVLFEPETIH